MNSRIKKPLAAILCCAVLAGGIGASVLAVTSDTADERKESEDKPQTAAKADDSSALVKDETVYVFGIGRRKCGKNNRQRLDQELSRRKILL